MNIGDKLTGALASVVMRPQPQNEAAPITTSAELDAHLSSGGMAASGVNVSERAMLGLPAFYAGVRLISETVAMLPFKLMLRLPDGGARPAYEHPQYPLTTVRPNNYQTPFEFFCLMQTRMVIRHNAAAFKILGPGGYVDKLMPIHPFRLAMRYSERSGDHVYDIRDDDGVVESGIPPERLLHLRGFSANGFLGWAPIDFLRDAFGGAIAAERYAYRVMANGAHIPGFARIPMAVDPYTLAKFKEELREYQGPNNAGRIPVFSGEGGGGMVEWVKMGMSPVEAEMIEARKFSLADVGRMLGIQSHYLNIQENQPRANWEAAGREFLMLTLNKWLVALRERFNVDCLTERDRQAGYFYQHVTAALVQANLAERYAAYKAADFLSQNEKRALEDWPMSSDPGADRIYPPAGVGPPTNE